MKRLRPQAPQGLEQDGETFETKIVGGEEQDGASVIEPQFPAKERAPGRIGGRSEVVGRNSIGHEIDAAGGNAIEMLEMGTGQGRDGDHAAARDGVLAALEFAHPTKAAPRGSGTAETPPLEPRKGEKILPGIGEPGAELRLQDIVVPAAAEVVHDVRPEAAEEILGGGGETFAILARAERVEAKRHRPGGRSARGGDNVNVLPFAPQPRGVLKSPIFEAAMAGIETVENEGDFHDAASG
jgi:hypothetical protein